MEAVIQDNYDLMALTELWDRPKKGWELEIKYPGRVFCSEATDETDPAAGAAIILSKRMAQRLMQVQAVGTRIIWCRIEGQFYNIIFISAYVPHKTRTDPTQAQNMQELSTLCQTLQTKYPDDQMLIGADFNMPPQELSGVEELIRRMRGTVVVPKGSTCKSAQGGRIIDFIIIDESCREQCSGAIATAPLRPARMMR